MTVPGHQLVVPSGKYSKFLINKRLELVSDCSVPSQLAFYWFASRALVLG